MDKVNKGLFFGISVLTGQSEETPLDRELQSTELARIMNSIYPAPVIFLGYVVTNPHASRRKLLFFISLAWAHLAWARSLPVPNTGSGRSCA